MVVENVRINGDSIPYAVFNPRIAIYSEIESKIIQPTIDEIQLGYVGVEEGLKDITERTNEALEMGEVF